MKKKKIVKIFFILFICFLIIFLIIKKLNKHDQKILIENSVEEPVYNSNIIENVEYSTKDRDGNEYLIKAEEGEIDFANPNIIYLKNVKALIKLENSETVKIISDYGKYNSENFNTIFSKNVIIDYLDNKINSNYLDFSLERNLMIISKNVIYNNSKNILNADVIEMDIKTKDTKIFMYEQSKKIKINSKN
ncbi:LPS export ABC transporter periplasmic protein LptC [Candidatus Pelagibacter sp. HIMB1587]|uniref:LPS export ABC transporter periplasmic protein LptC n=1 Tax=Candidatus Pelagibacter sp. HIMB1587 TaxID=3413354 RepID=UPI003F866B0F